MESERHKKKKKKKANLTTAFPSIYKNKKEEKKRRQQITSQSAANLDRTCYCFASKRRIFFIVGESKKIYNRVLNLGKALALDSKNPF